MLKPRKCRFCGKYIHIPRDRDMVVKFGTWFVHTDCFAKYRTTTGKAPWSQEKLGAFLPLLKEETNVKIEELLAADEEKTKQEAIAKKLANVQEERRKEFFDFIRDTYAPAVVPGKFYAKLQRYVFGIEPRYAGSIPPEHFLDMWRRMLPKLNKIDENNRAHDKVIHNRWDYDLTIVLANYPSYLAWRQKQASQAQAIRDAANIAQENKIIKAAKSTPKTSPSDDIDISSMLDEI